jgi:C_GCAxxG_C_C family probable redox protein
MRKIMSKSEDANKCFISGFNCAQAVFSTFSKELGLDEQTALKIGGSFGAGMAYLDETCGAVTGAFMAIGLKFGRCKLEDSASKEKTYALVKEFSKQFKEKYGSLRCTDLIGYNLSTEEGLKKATEEKRFRTHCPKFVEDAAGIVETLMKA